MTTYVQRWTPEQAAELRRLAIASHPRIRVVLTGRDEGLSWEQIAVMADTTVTCVKGWDYEWNVVQHGIVPGSGQTAWRAAYIAKLVRQSSPTLGLRVALDAYLAELSEINPEINVRTPARPGVLGGHSVGSRAVEPVACSECHLVHPGECD